MYKRGKKNVATKWEKFANECSIGYWVFTIMAYFSFIQSQHFEQCEINFLKIETKRAIWQEFTSCKTHYQQSLILFVRIRKLDKFQLFLQTRTQKNLISKACRT